MKKAIWRVLARVARGCVVVVFFLAVLWRLVDGSELSFLPTHFSS